MRAADSLRRSSLLLRHSVGDVTVTYLPHDGDVEEEHQDERREIRDDLVPVVSVQGVKGGHDERAQRRDVPSATWQDGGGRGGCRTWRRFARSPPPRSTQRWRRTAPRFRLVLFAAFFLFFFLLSFFFLSLFSFSCSYSHSRSSS